MLELDPFEALVGRFIWRDGRSATLDGLIAETGDHPWLKAGLAGGSVENVKAAVEALRNFIKQFPRF